MPPDYSPERGDIVWITLQPQAGDEPSGRRPALVLSPGEYNTRVGLAILVPITSQVKGYPFEVMLPQGLPVAGVVLSDQVKSFDWRARIATFACRVPKATVTEALRKVSVLLST